MEQGRCPVGEQVSRTLLPIVLVLAAAITYPVAVMSRGVPHFPDRHDCVDLATKDGDLEAVFGRFDRRAEANAKLRVVLGRGFTGSEIQGDGCGRLKVVVHGIRTLAVGRELAAEARKAGLEVTLEYATP
jgi:hypothetical protein